MPVSFYINSLPDSKSWKMRLTSNGLTLSTGVAGNGSGFKHKRFASPLGGTCPAASVRGSEVYQRQPELDDAVRGQQLQCDMQPGCGNQSAPHCCCH